MPATVIKNSKALKIYMQWKSKAMLIDKSISKSFVFNQDSQLETSAAQYFESEEDTLWNS